jgi:hypothetical protein
MPQQSNNNMDAKMTPSSGVINFDEESSPYVQPNIPKKKLVPAVVNYLDDSQHQFYVNVSKLSFKFRY